MKTNLLLLDSYVNIDNLLSVAFALSKRMNAKLKIIFVFDFAWMSQSYLTSTAGPANPNLLAIEANARKEFNLANDKIKEAIKQVLPKEAQNVEYEINASEFKRIDIVNSECEKANELLLLLNSYQSYTEASGGLIGYPDILSHVKCPVLVLPENIAQLNWSHILYATDYNPADIDAIQQLTRMVGPDTELTIMHVTKKNDFNGHQLWVGFTELVKEKTDAEKIKFKLVENREVEEGIKDFVASYKPDIIAVLKEKKGFFKQLFESSDTKFVLSKFNKPTFVFHD